jgi:Zn finger protein HypA/HybF involved in hydrogenase expression
VGDWKQNPVVGIAAVVAAVLAFGWLGYAALPKKVKALVKCEACKVEYEARISRKAEFPLICVKCGKPRVYRAQQLRCMKCQHAFLALIKIPKAPTTPPQKSAGGGPPKELLTDTSAMRKCPKCGAIQLQIVEEKEEKR